MMSRYTMPFTPNNFTSVFNKSEETAKAKGREKLQGDMARCLNGGGDYNNPHQANAFIKCIIDVLERKENEGKKGEGRRA